MAHFIFKTFSERRLSTASVLPALRFDLVAKNPWKYTSSSARCISTEAEAECSFPVTYLMETLGFSPKSAISAARRLNFETPDRPNSVLAFFKAHGFSHSQVSKVVSGCPRILLSNPEKSLLPKLEFFYSKGAATYDVARIVSSSPSILTRSLERSLIPSFNFYDGFFKSQRETFLAMKRFGSTFSVDPGTSPTRNLQILRDCGVPESKILFLLRFHGLIVKTSATKFKEAVEEARRIGFDPKTSKFLTALLLLISCGKSTWKRKVVVYRKWGWSEGDLLGAFRLYPWFVGVSEDKVMVVMDFLVNQMDMKPLAIARCPAVLSLSFAKRIVPRASVAQVLVAKGLIKKDFNLHHMFCYAEKRFLKRYVHAYEEEVPDLLKLYKEKLDLSQLP